MPTRTSPPALTARPHPRRSCADKDTYDSCKKTHDTVKAAVTVLAAAASRNHMHSPPPTPRNGP